MSTSGVCKSVGWSCDTGSSARRSGPTSCSSHVLKGYETKFWSRKRESIWLKDCPCSLSVNGVFNSWCGRNDNRRSWQRSGCITIITEVVGIGNNFSERSSANAQISPAVRPMEWVKHLTWCASGIVAGLELEEALTGIRIPLKLVVSSIVVTEDGIALGLTLVEAFVLHFVMPKRCV